MEYNKLTLIDTDDILVQVIERESTVTTFCFAGVGFSIGGVDIQKLEFKKASKDSTTIFVIDKKRSWGNNINFIDLREKTDSFLRGKTVNAIGNSMGGFLSILSTKYFEISSCVAFCPQYSVRNNIIPGEIRWKQYTDRIVDWTHHSLDDCFLSDTNYYIFFGSDSGLEDQQKNKFPLKRNVFIFSFEDRSWAHNVARKLNESNQLYSVIESCFNRASPDVILLEHLSHFSATLLRSDS